MIDEAHLIAQIEQLPTFSLAAAKLLHLLQDPDSDAVQLERVLREDASLTANLLRLANSSFYRGQSEISSVREAITRLGMRQVFALSASMAFARILPEQLPGYRIDAQGFWKHSLAVAVFAEKLGQHCGIGGGGQIFTAGLLHDLGKLAIGVFLEARQVDLRQQLDEHRFTFIEAERNLLGTDHTEVGFAIARRWNLPDSIAQAARHHHRPLEAPAGEAAAICKVVHVGNALAHLFGYGSDLGELSRSLEPEVLRQLGLDSDGLERIVCLALEPIREMGAVLQF